ncbi:MAG: hypothetical protein SGILL_006776 [Bacillariaceae sp.]
MKSEPAASKQKKPKREIQVVSCPSAFPISTKTKSKSNSSSAGRKRSRDEAPKHNSNDHNFNKRRDKSSELLDWHDTAKEIRAYGATAFVGKQKRDYQDEQYFQLTGRHQKKQKVPLPIVRGIRKASAKRDLKLREEAQKAGVVLPKTSKDEKRKAADSTYRSHGPAPSIGFMKQGVFRVKKKGGGGRGGSGGGSSRSRR